MIPKKILFVGITYFSSKAEGTHFYRLKLHWENNYDWQKAQLCVACVKDGCTNGITVLKSCDKNDGRQLWSKSLADDKIRPKLNMNGCLSFKDPDAFVRIRPCKTKWDSYQRVKVNASGIKFQIEGENVGKGKCLSPVSSPDINVRLKMIPCAKALRKNVVYWTIAEDEEDSKPTPPDHPPTTQSPIPVPTMQLPNPEYPISSHPVTANDSVLKYPVQIVLGSNGRMDRDDFVSSLNGKYRVIFTTGGDLVLQDDRSNNIWRAGVSGGEKCFMQRDGNVVIRSGVQGAKALWSSETNGNYGAALVVDNGGRIGVLHGTNWIWLHGVPRGSYDGPSSENLEFPTRGIFYYPWYPETWTINGQYAHFKPDLGFYSSSDPRVAKNHINSLKYANVDLSIASWWGPNEQLDRSRLTLLMDETVAAGSSLKWTVYHEDERKLMPSSQQIRKDLDYLKKWFAWHPAWAHVDGRPLIFVYNEGSVGCDTANRWMAASQGEWYVVLKLFKNYKKCTVQPDHWHQYGVGGGRPLVYDDYSFSIAPGFWKANSPTPQTPRVSKEDWCNNVEKMAASDEPWHLIISFNEAGEGTMIEASSSWKSNTKYGYYLDCLHNFKTIR